MYVGRTKWKLKAAAKEIMRKYISKYISDVPKKSFYYYFFFKK